MEITFEKVVLLYLRTRQLHVYKIRNYFEKEKNTSETLAPSESLLNVFTAETNSALNHLASSQELLLSQTMRRSKRQTVILKNTQYWRK